MCWAGWDWGCVWRFVAPLKGPFLLPVGALPWQQVPHLSMTDCLTHPYSSLTLVCALPPLQAAFW